jgi:hypothetical protein
MDKDGRASPRVPVSMRMVCAAAEGGSLRVLDLSLGGLLARGRISSGEGEALEGTIHVEPKSGDRDVVVRGMGVRVVPDGEESLIGMKIESFDSADGAKAYQDFVNELYADG